MNDAEKTINNFFVCWQEQRWYDMAGICQKSWAHSRNKEEKIEMLKDFFADKELQSFKINKISKHSSVMIEASVKIKYRSVFSKMIRRIVHCRCICELSPFRPSISGQWGINPISVLRET
jgi:hypothetical protein